MFGKEESEIIAISSEACICMYMSAIIAISFQTNALATVMNYTATPGFFM